MLLKSAVPPSILTVIPTRNRLPNLARFKCGNAHEQKPPQTVRGNASSTSLVLLSELAPTSAYIHLPFCRKRCHYCDFPIIAVGSSLSNLRINNDPRFSNYIETLCREIKATKLNFACATSLETVFFGGGTPSLVPPWLVSSVLDSLSSKFGVCDSAEISMEMDPGTFDAVKLKELVSLGVNRVSLGVQAFQEQLLKACGRAHGLDEVYEAIGTIKSCGIKNWSLDLISSLPHQTLDMWEESLRLTIQAQPTHVSVYDLQVEKGTKFGNLYTPGKFPLPSDVQSAEFYKMASRMLRDADYNHYEISSYCKRGYRCKHNSTYWKNKSFYGFGLGSASYVDGIRFSRPRRLNDYIGYVHNLEEGIISSDEKGSTDPKEMAMDVVMLSLRTSDGFDLKSFENTFGGSLTLSICEVYKPYVESGHIMCSNDQGEDIQFHEFMSLLSKEHQRNDELAFLRLSDPDGFLLSNELISLAFSVISP